MKKTVYDVTRKQCLEQIIKAGNRVCSRCGKKIVPLKTVTNGGIPTYWSGCNHNNKLGSWGHFDHGVTKETYQLAVNLVLEDSYKFQIKKESSDFEYWFMESVSHNCNLLAQIDYIKNNKPRYSKNKLKSNYLKYYAK